MTDITTSRPALRPKRAERPLCPSPRATSPAVSRVMKANGARNTGPEIMLRKALRGIGLAGYRLHLRNVPGRPDIAYPGPKVAVFVNGCFWHRCPHCGPSAPKSNSGFWLRKFELNRERDRRKTRELRKSGWKVVVAWECQIKKDPAKVARRVQRFVLGEQGELRTTRKSNA